MLYKPPESGPKILLVDIETAPMLGYIWGLWDNNVALNQLHTDWYVLSWAAKWLGAPDEELMYQDQRNSPDIMDDSILLNGIWHLLNESDIVIGQNSKRFDTKKLNARFILNGYSPPAKYRQIDTLETAKRRFAFSSNKLEYLTEKLCTKNKKLKHKKYPGFELWRACMQRDLEAFDEMKDYNKVDVLALEELYLIFRPWMDNHPNLNVYIEGPELVCHKCGSDSLHKRGFAYTNLGKYQKWRCICGSETRDRVNLLTKEKRTSLQANIV